MLGQITARLWVVKWGHFSVQFYFFLNIHTEKTNGLIMLMAISIWVSFNHLSLVFLQNCELFQTIKDRLYLAFALPLIPSLSQTYKFFRCAQILTSPKVFTSWFGPDWVSSNTSHVSLLVSATLVSYYA